MDTGDTDELSERHADVGAALAIVAALGPRPALPPVTIPVELTARVQRAADRTGFTVEEIIRCADAPLIEPDAPATSGG